MRPKFCSVEGCDRIVAARGFCDKHYHAKWRAGEIVTERRPLAAKLAASEAQARRIDERLERIEALLLRLVEKTA